MSRDEFEAVLGELGLSTTAAAHLLGVNERTARRWVSGASPIPAPAARFLRYLAKSKTPLQEVIRVLR